MVNVPQAMAHALLAMVNPVFGIYTLMVAVPIGAIFTSSVYMNVSTTSALSVAAGSSLVDTPASQRIEALAVLVLLVGVIQLLAGLFRLGFLIRFVSNAVMTGFLNGVAVLIVLGQLGNLTGFRSTFSRQCPQGAGSDIPFRPDQSPDDHHRLTDPGRDCGTVIHAAAQVRLHHCDWLGHGAAGAVDAARTAHCDHFNSVRTVRARSPRSRDLCRNWGCLQPSLILAMLLPAFSRGTDRLDPGAGVSQGYPNPDGKYPDVGISLDGCWRSFATSFVGGVPAGGSISGTALLMSAGALDRAWLTSPPGCS